MNISTIANILLVLLVLYYFIPNGKLQDKRPRFEKLSEIPKPIIELMEERVEKPRPTEPPTTTSTTTTSTSLSTTSYATSTTKVDLNLSNFHSPKIEVKDHTVTIKITYAISQKVTLGLVLCNNILCLFDSCNSRLEETNVVFTCSSKPPIQSPTKDHQYLYSIFTIPTEILIFQGKVLTPENYYAPFDYSRNLVSTFANGKQLQARKNYPYFNFTAYQLSNRQFPVQFNWKYSCHFNSEPFFHNRLIVFIGKSKKAKIYMQAVQRQGPKLEVYRVDDVFFFRKKLIEDSPSILTSRKEIDVIHMDYATVRSVELLIKTVRKFYPGKKPMFITPEYIEGPNLVTGMIKMREYLFAKIDEVHLIDEFGKPFLPETSIHDLGYSLIFPMLCGEKCRDDRLSLSPKFEKKTTSRPRCEGFDNCVNGSFKNCDPARTEKINAYLEILEENERSPVSLKNRWIKNTTVESLCGEKATFKKTNYDMPFAKFCDPTSEFSCCEGEEKFHTFCKNSNNCGGNDFSNYTWADACFYELPDGEVKYQIGLKSAPR